MTEKRLVPALLVLVLLVCVANLVQSVVPRHRRGLQAVAERRSLDEGRAEPGYPAAAVPVRAPTTEDLGARIQRLDSLLTEALNRLEQARGASRTPVELQEEGPGYQVLEQELQSLSEHVERLHTALRNHAWLDRPPSLDEVRSGKDSTDWDQVFELAARHAADPESALESVRFLTYTEVLDRYGPPTSMLTDGTWWYEAPPAADREGRVVLILSFLNAYVVGLKVPR